MAMGTQKTTKREQVINTTLRLIHEHGFRGTTMRDIAQVMECDVANLYNHVRSKHAILEDALFGISGFFHKGLDQILDSQYTPREQLKMIISLYVKLSFDRPSQSCGRTGYQ